MLRLIGVELPERFADGSGNCALLLLTSLDVVKLEMDLADTLYRPRDDEFELPCESEE